MFITQRSESKRINHATKPGKELSIRIPVTLLCGFDQPLKGFRLAHGDIGQNLAVQLDPGLLQAVDELAIGRAMNARGGVDALDP